jgi:enoyl-CoA hydratase
MVEIILEAPGKNALSTELMNRLSTALHQAKGEPVLLRGAGDVFCAGFNLREVAGLDDAAMQHFLTTAEDLYQQLFEYEAPTVAAVHGHAIAGGCLLALACDLRVASSQPSTRIGLKEVALGLVFPPRLWALVAHRLPPQALDRLVLEAGLYDPETARSLGLIDLVVDDPLAVARERMATLEGHPRAAYVHAKRALRRGVMTASPEQERHLRENVVPQWCSPEIKARMTSALKR